MTTTDAYIPAVDDIVTLDPQASREYVIVALDDLYDEFVYVELAYNPADLPAQWRSKTYIRRVVEQEDATE